MARIGPFSNVDRFMIIKKPQKFFFPTFVSDYNNPKRYRNKDMKVNLNKGAIEGLSLEQGSSFPLLPAPWLQRTLLDVHVDFDKKQHEMLQPSKCDIRRSRAWAELQQTCRLKDGCSLGAYTEVCVGTLLNVLQLLQFLE